MNQRRLPQVCHLLLAVCSYLFSIVVMAQVPPPEQPVIRLATTTSTDHSGLLDWLLPHFEQQTGYQVQVLARGSGQCLRLGQQGDVDILLTHAPEAEAAFIANGYGSQAHPLMHNDFVLLGPQQDPAAIAQLADPSAALRAIAAHGDRFISRGDGSGTHQKERALWGSADPEAGDTPTWPGYISTGQGMGPVLTMASELEAYTLSDRATWLAYRQSLALAVLLEGHPKLINPYQVILINPARFPQLNHDGANTLSDWLLGTQGRQLITEFRVSGEQLFFVGSP